MLLTRTLRYGFSLLLTSGFFPLQGYAEPLFFGPSAYRSSADIPIGFYTGGSPTVLETFEDGLLNFGITASAGSILFQGSITDSVDADDGNIDGYGISGRSWFSIAGSSGVTFTFSGSLPTAAGMVWTDGSGTTSFQAFGPGMVSLGQIGPVALADGTFAGTTGEDRFFGVQDAGGILAIRLSNTSGGIEIDHLQYGIAPSSSAPEPTAFSLLAIGLAALYRRGFSRSAQKS